MTLVEFLTARLDEDEEATRVGHFDPTYDSSPVPTLMDHGEMYVPGGRWLAEVDAKRRTVALHEAEPGQHPNFCGHDLRKLPCPTLRLLALPYADHPDYDEAWRP